MLLKIGIYTVGSVCPPRRTGWYIQRAKTLWNFLPKGILISYCCLKIIYILSSEDLRWPFHSLKNNGILLNGRTPMSSMRFIHISFLGMFHFISFIWFFTIFHSNWNNIQTGIQALSKYMYCERKHSKKKPRGLVE